VDSALRLLPRPQTDRVQTPASTLQPSDRIRLAAHLILVRRDDRDIQLGVDVEGALVLADPDGAVTTLLQLMDGRYRLAELTVVADQRGLADHLEVLLEALMAAGALQHPAPARGPETHSIRLVGLGPAGELVAEQLLRARIGRLVTVEPGASSWRGWGAGHDQVQRADHWSQPTIDAVDLTILVSDDLEPDRAVTAELTRADHPHLVVRPRAHGAVVGPLVVPGRTSCVRCGDIARTRTDPAWPRMLAQLCRTRGQWDPLAAEWAAALTTTQVLAHLAGRSAQVAAATFELGPINWTWQRRVWAADPACACCWAAR
jgi:hypothetical protein